MYKLIEEKYSAEFVQSLQTDLVEILEINVQLIADRQKIIEIVDEKGSFSKADLGQLTWFRVLGRRNLSYRQINNN